MTTTANEMDKALYDIDETGLVTLQATPEWWRKMEQATDWPEIAEIIAQAGESARSEDVCGVIGRTTHRPCRHNTRRHGACPNHCETPLPFHCAMQRKKGGWCRSDLRNGPCKNHPDSYEEYMAAIRADEEEELQRQAAREQEARKAAQERHDATLRMRCPYCDAQPGSPCVRQNGEQQIKLHSARENLWLHTEAASAAPCSYCKAAVGELCRTSSGNIAGQAHADR
ncbi:hypothetical protein AB0I82_35210 [Streptomyces sp. NPDC050315]|uniref:zinc finger domain-containing protein n=1 Tax=Streptomyces sp. NPDC050315 TaxID=3155039 RepID=UPI003418C170